MDSDKKVILIAEDDSVIRELLIAMLKTAGYDLVTATDGVEAVEAFKTHSNNIQLIITDIGMPRMNGIEAIVVIRKMSDTVPIMILSIWEQADYKRIADENKVKEYMRKPFDVHELIRRVGELVQDVPPQPQAHAA